MSVSVASTWLIMEHVICCSVTYLYFDNLFPQYLYCYKGLIFAIELTTFRNFIVHLYYCWSDIHSSHYWIFDNYKKFQPFNTQTFTNIYIIFYKFLTKIFLFLLSLSVFISDSPTWFHMGFKSCNFCSVHQKQFVFGRRNMSSMPRKIWVAYFAFLSRWSIASV